MSHYVDVAIEAAKRAEKVILEYFESRVPYERKKDNSPVTIADQKAEELIRETIAKYFPDHGILGEEFGVENGGAKYQWVIDPIDGTKNFMRGIPNFGTLIALLENDQVIAAVSNMPVIGELMRSELGHGAFCNDVRVHVSDVDDLSDAFLVYGGIHRFEQNGLLPQLLELSKTTMGHRGLGDCGMYHLLAQGKVDIVIEAKINAWDVAAGSLLVSEAGGKATDMQRRHVGLSTVSSLAANCHLYERVLSLLGTSPE